MNTNKNDKPGITLDNPLVRVAYTCAREIDPEEGKDNRVHSGTGNDHSNDNVNNHNDGDSNVDINPYDNNSYADEGHCLYMINGGVNCNNKGNNDEDWGNRATEMVTYDAEGYGAIGLLQIHIIVNVCILINWLT